MGFFDNVRKAFASKKEDASLQNSVNEEVIDKPTPNDKIRNFKNLDDLIHSGVKEIVLYLDVELGPDEESQYWEGIKLDVDDLTIDGNGHTIDAQGLTRIFYCTGKNITIKNIILKNGFAKDGGAIYKYGGDLIITESIFNNNAAHGEYGGGAIYNWVGELIITESIFNNNAAQGEYGGGAIFNWTNELIITESIFNNNSTQGEHGGGAIQNWGSLKITKSTLNENMASVNGGAINNTGMLTISESTLNENTASVNGGAINNGHGLTITSSTLNENRAEEDGGAIYNNKQGNFKIFNCEFSSNKSPNNIILNNDSLQIQNTIFKDNQSKDIVLNDDGANLGIFYGEFKENNIEKSVLCNDGKFCSIEKTVFQNNISNNTLNIINNTELTLTDPKIKDNGKSILNEKYILIRKSSHGLENKIFGDGTVESIENRIPQGEKFDFGYLDKKIHESNTKEIILGHDITFENYERDFYEGGIELDIDNLIIDGNGKTINGLDKSRIFIITGKNIILKNIIFKNGHSHRNHDNFLNNSGGAIKINYNTNTTIENCEFINNVSEGFGGAINNGGELTITESTLTENTAKIGGAISNWEGGSLTITESALNNNMAHTGGAMYGSSLTIIGSTLEGNTAKVDGGAISGGSLTITESALNNNMAHTGGAIYGGDLTIIESALQGNTASDNGGAINNTWSSTIIVSTLQGNTAKNGGAIYNTGMLTISESKLIGNTAEEGGAIYFVSSVKYESKKCTFKDNEPDDVYEE